MNHFFLSETKVLVIRLLSVFWNLPLLAGFISGCILRPDCEYLLPLIIHVSTGTKKSRAVLHNISYVQRLVIVETLKQWQITAYEKIRLIRGKLNTPNYCH